jgi:hypothetical protein
MDAACSTTVAYHTHPYSKALYNGCEPGVFGRSAQRSSAATAAESLYNGCLTALQPASEHAQNKASIQYLNNLRQTSLGAYHQIF